ncbi:hypothetical protein FRB97_000180 [Tulasnella sp. 331]|nr:hypothetical protein FRB97_000180 [Tulasnella sp. 331]
MSRSLFSRASSSRESSWEVVDHQEIAPTSIYSGSAVHLTPLSLELVCHTYTIDRICASGSHYSPESSRSPSPAPSTVRRPRSALAAYLTKEPFRSLSRTPSRDSLQPDDESVLSYYGSEDTYDPDRTPRTSMTSLPSDETDVKYDQLRLRAQIERDEESSHYTLRDALIFARDQLMCSPEVTSFGGNVLSVERWSVTRLQRGNQERLLVRYCGQPARATFPSSSTRKWLSLPRNRPPFMEILHGS